MQSDLAVPFTSGGRGSVCSGHFPSVSTAGISHKARCSSLVLSLHLPHLSPAHRAAPRGWGPVPLPPRTGHSPQPLTSQPLSLPALRPCQLCLRVPENENGLHTHRAGISPTRGRTPQGEAAVRHSWGCAHGAVSVGCGAVLVGLCASLSTSMERRENMCFFVVLP